MCLIDRVPTRNLLLHAVKRVNVLAIASCRLGRASFTNDTRPTRLCDQHVRLRLRFFELLLQAAQRVFEVLDFDLLIGNLLLEVRCVLLASERSFKRGTGEIVLFL